ncbi:cytochrome c [Catenovulum sp. SM1970]|uniref:c-type cytochrome n=1 Tax=Marinifaba aquimaris TaxID=2741323 RepID=UPI001571F012|nr:cytochrome c [Marinifaba aquimaris]NTS75517.1 cytochrome c [Marinifaba aquimaris]
MKLLTKIAIAFSFAGIANLSYAADIEAGKAKTAMCVACHGADGKSVMPIYPNLAGQNAAYIESALHAYKKGQRTGGQAGIMAGMAAALTDQDIKNIAAYYSSLK